MRKPLQHPSCRCMSGDAQPPPRKAMCSRTKQPSGTMCIPVCLSCDRQRPAASSCVLAAGPTTLAFDSGSPGPDRQPRAATALTSTAPSPSSQFSTTSGSPHLRHIEPAGRVELGKNSNGGQAFRRAPPVAQTNLKTSMIAPPPPRLSHGIPEFPDKLLMRASPARCAAQGVDPRGRECLLRLSVCAFYAATTFQVPPGGRARGFHARVRDCGVHHLVVALGLLGELGHVHILFPAVLCTR